MLGIDMELQLARKSEKNKASLLMQQFTQVVAYTLTARHPDVDYGD